MLCLKVPEDMEQDDKIPLQGKQPRAPEEKFSWAFPESPRVTHGASAFGWAQHSVKRKIWFRTTRGKRRSAPGTQSPG